MKHLFQLPETGHYINCAYMSPLLKSVEEAGIMGIQRKRFPIHIGPADYFSEVQEVRELFGRLIHAPANQRALVFVWFSQCDFQYFSPTWRSYPDGG